MEQTTLQYRIEERAKRRLEKDLLKAADKQQELIGLIGKNHFPEVLNVYSYYDEYAEAGNKQQIVMKGDKTKEIFDSLLPNYIRMVTDEILEKIDQIDYLLAEKSNQDY
jgi:hypothetical protein